MSKPKIIQISNMPPFSFKKRLLVFAEIFGGIWLFLEPLTSFSIGVGVMSFMGVWGYVGLFLASLTGVVCVELFARRRIPGQIGFVFIKILLPETGSCYNVKTSLDLEVGKFINLFLEYLEKHPAENVKLHRNKGDYFCLVERGSSKELGLHLEFKDIDVKHRAVYEIRRNTDLCLPVTPSAENRSFGQNPDVVPWLLLHTEARHIVSNIFNNWAKLLNDKTLNEGIYRDFLSENAGLFFCNDDKDIVVIAQLNLSESHIVDLVRAHDNRSFGFSYEIINVQSPHIPIYTSTGKPSLELSQAIQAVTAWQRWAEDKGNRELTKQLFPSKNFTLFNRSDFRYTLYMGRRIDNMAWQRKRHEIDEKYGVRIRSFDELSEQFWTNAKRPRFPLMCSSEERAQLSLYQRNEIVNPFAKAYSNLAWRKIVGSSSFSVYHMVANNIELLLSQREYNNWYYEYLNVWKSLSPGLQAEYRYRICL